MYLIWELFPPLEDEKLNPESTHNVLDPVSIENEVFHLISDFPGSTLRRPPCKQKTFYKIHWEDVILTWELILSP